MFGHFCWDVCPKTIVNLQSDQSSRGCKEKKDEEKHGKLQSSAVKKTKTVYLKTVSK